MLGMHSFFTKANISSDMRTIVEKYMGPGGFTKEAKGNETGIVWGKGAPLSVCSQEIRLIKMENML